MKIGRVWAMPNKWTFKIPPIAELINRYVGDGRGWIDPFAGMSKIAEFTNDINPDMPTSYHFSAIDFCSLFVSCKGALFDPPYSSTQVKVCYDSLQYKPAKSRDDFLLAFDKVKDAIGRKIRLGGYCISFGWNSNGLGRTRGFSKVEILLVAHGGHHNDTIVTVERKSMVKLG